MTRYIELDAEYNAVVVFVNRRGDKSVDKIPVDGLAQVKSGKIVGLYRGRDVIVWNADDRDIPQWAVRALGIED